MNVTVPPITPGSLRRVFSKKLSLVPGFLDAEAKPIWFTTSILAMPGATSVALIVSTDRSCLSPWSSDAFSQAQAGSVIRRFFTRSPLVMDQLEALDCGLRTKVSGLIHRPSWHRTTGHPLRSTKRKTQTAARGNDSPLVTCRCASTPRRRGSDVPRCGPCRFPSGPGWWCQGLS
jgi:hypothetical protein